MIERDLPGIAGWSDAERRAAAQQSNKVLRELGRRSSGFRASSPTTSCMHLAPDETTIREHARRAGFPANRISADPELIDPTTGE